MKGKEVFRKIRISVAMLLLFVTVFGQAAVVSQAVAPSDVTYDVFLNGGELFFCNQETAGSKNGTEYFMTYTVVKNYSSARWQALVSTEDAGRRYPYDNGGVIRRIADNQAPCLMDEGATYFIKFTVAEGGFRYKITRAKGNTLEDLYVGKVSGDATDAMKYFGIWLWDGTTDAYLTNVRCYDASGKDLGVQVKSYGGSSTVVKGGVNLKKDTQVKESYDITVTNKKNIALSNLTETTSSKVYIEYKVASADYLLNQAGIALSNEPTKQWPHENSQLKYKRYEEFVDSVILLEVGAEYIILVERTETDFSVFVKKTKDGISEKFVISRAAGTLDTSSKFISLWFGTGDESYATFKLENFKIYDENKKNLQVQSNRVSSATIVRANALNGVKKDTKINHSYDIVLTNKKNIAISNLKPVKTEQLYIEYKVASAEYMLNQAGIAISNSPKAQWPHDRGQLQYLRYEKPTDKVDLLDPGAEYLILIERSEKNACVYVRKTKDGVSKEFSLTNAAGQYDKDAKYFSLWFGEGDVTKATFTLENFKIYDQNRNNLMVQCNQNAVIKHKGDLEDYAGCEALYFCKEKNDFIALYKDKTIRHTENKIDRQGTYRIDNNVMTVVYEDGTATYDYLYKRITDKEGNVYERLYTYKVTFVSGKGSKVPTQVMSNENGYQVMKPTDPTFEGYKFMGWCTKDGKEFDFEQIITESVTLYAKWSGDGGKTFISITDNANGILQPAQIAVGITIVLLALLVSILIVKGGVKRGKRKE